MSLYVVRRQAKGAQQRVMRRAIVWGILPFHGRGFSPSESITLHDPVAALAALEAITGPLIRNHLHSVVLRPVTGGVAGGRADRGVAASVCFRLSYPRRGCGGVVRPCGAACGRPLPLQITQSASAPALPVDSGSS